MYPALTDTVPLSRGLRSTTKYRNHLSVFTGGACVIKPLPPVKVESTCPRIK